MPERPPKNPDAKPQVDRLIDELAQGSAGDKREAARRQPAVR